MKIPINQSSTQYGWRAPITGYTSRGREVFLRIGGTLAKLKLIKVNAPTGIIPTHPGRP